MLCWASIHECPGNLLGDPARITQQLRNLGQHCDFGYLGYIPVIKFMSDHLAGEEQP
jgi:hypothetical protein